MPNLWGMRNQHNPISPGRGSPIPERSIINGPCQQLDREGWAGAAAQAQLMECAACGAWKGLCLSFHLSSTHHSSSLPQRDLLCPSVTASVWVLASDDLPSCGHLHKTFPVFHVSQEIMMSPRVTGLPDPEQVTSLLPMLRLFPRSVKFTKLFCLEKPSKIINLHLIPSPEL